MSLQERPYSGMGSGRNGLCCPTGPEGRICGDRIDRTYWNREYSGLLPPLGGVGPAFGHKPLPFQNLTGKEREDGY